MIIIRASQKKLRQPFSFRDHHIMACIDFGVSPASLPPFWQKASALMPGAPWCNGCMYLAGVLRHAFLCPAYQRGSSWENLSDAVQPRRCHRDWSCIGQPPAVQKGVRGRQPPAFAHSLGPVKIEVLCGFCLYIEKRLSILRQEGRKLDYVPDSRTDSLGQLRNDSASIAMAHYYRLRKVLELQHSEQIINMGVDRSLE
jgi:hypothetical protein